MKRFIGILCLLMAASIWADKHGYIDVPVIPDQVVNPAPEGEGFHVLIIEDSDNRDKLSQSQLETVVGTALKIWMDNNGAEWRIWDEQMNLSQETDPWWMKAMECHREGLPWIVSNKGKRGISQALPADTEATIKLLEGVNNAVR